MRVNIYVNPSGGCDLQGEVYDSRSDRIRLIDSQADDLDSAVAWLDGLRDEYDYDFSYTVYRSA